MFKYMDVVLILLMTALFAMGLAFVERIERL
jgi:hypothetical protein